MLGPDEPRYAWIAREMAEAGDWVTPRLYGKPWFEKPPLYYWGAALGFKFFGVSDATARLPGAVSALLATLVLAWLAWRLYGMETSLWLLLLLPSTVGMIGFSHAAAPDMPFAATLTIAMAAAAILLRLEVATSDLAQYAGQLEQAEPFARTKWLAALVFGISLGLAVLAKGPGGIILAGGAIFLWALVTSRCRDAFHLLHPIAIAAFCLTTLPWYVLCARRNPDFFRIFIIEHNFKRYLTPEFQHIQPFWFYVPVLLVAVLPWTLLLFPVIADVTRSIQNRLHSGAPGVFFASWIVFPLLFFSFSQSKLPGYILPAVPPLVLLMADGMAKRIFANSWLLRVLFAPTPLITFVLIAGGFAYSLRLRGMYRLRQFAEDEPVRFWIFVLACVACLVAAIVATSGRPRTAAFCTLAALIAFILSANLTTLDAALSPRQTCRELIRAKAPDEEVFLCRVARSYTYGINFYLGHEAPEWTGRDTQRRAVVIIGSPACWSDLTGVKYRLRAELNTRWPVIELEPSASGLSRGGQPQ